MRISLPLVLILVCGCGAASTPLPKDEEQVVSDERLENAHEQARNDLDRVVGGEPAEPDLRPVDLDPEMLQEAERRVLKDHKKKRLAEVKRCVSQGTRSGPVTGLLVVELKVAKGGSVTEARAVQCPLEDSACRCVESAFRRFRHRLAKESESNATVSFDLAEGSGGTAVHPLN